jgi:hypothetical protein
MKSPPFRQDFAHVAGDYMCLPVCLLPCWHDNTTVLVCLSIGRKKNVKAEKGTDLL